MRTRYEGLTRGSECDRTRGSLKERIAHQLFKSPDLLRECRLGKMQGCGSSAKVQMFCDCDKGTQVTQLKILIHAYKVSIWMNKRLDATIFAG